MLGNHDDEDDDDDFDDNDDNVNENLRTGQGIVVNPKPCSGLLLLLLHTQPL